MSAWSVESHEDDSVTLSWPPIEVTIRAGSHREAHGLAYDLAGLLEARGVAGEVRSQLDAVSRRLNAIDEALKSVLREARAAEEELR